MRVKGTLISVDRLLDAAENVVLRDGIGKLTLDAVAEEAGVSKGGLMYHFTSKDKLVEAMVVRINELCRLDHLKAIEDAGPGPGRVPRGLLNMCQCKPAEWKETIRRTSTVLMAALVSNPALVRPLRESYLQLHDMVKRDGLAPGYGEVVLAAMDGMWLSLILGLDDVLAERTSDLRRALEDVIQRGIEQAQSGACAQGANGTADHGRAHDNGSGGDIAGTAQVSNVGH